jgi:valyl-tRNA synthetase
MSKTRGNTLDPLELIDQYGTDALRFALTTGTAPGNDMRITQGKLESSRNFANKVWNAARYVMTSLPEPEQLRGWHDLAGVEHREDRWIVTRLDRVTAEVDAALQAFELGEAQQKLYEFVWDDFCDWYIEMAKIRLRSGAGPSPLPTLVHVLERTLRLLHPFMPFITEEVWQNLLPRLPDEGNLPKSIMVAPYPQPDASRQDRQAENEVALVMQAVRAVRNTRAQLRIPANQRLEAVVEAAGWQSAIEEEADVIRTMSRIEPLRIVADTDARDAPAWGVTLVVNPLVVRLPLEGVVDLSAERQRLEEELTGVRKNLDRVEKLVNNPNFRAKARPDVVETEEERFQSLTEQTTRLEQILADLGA